MLKKWAAFIISAVLVFCPAITGFAAENAGVSNGSVYLMTEKSENQNEDSETSITNIFFSRKPPKQFSAGAMFTVELTVLPATTDQEISWISSNENVIRINANGTDDKTNGEKARCSLTACAPGSATVTAEIDGKTASLYFAEPTIHSLVFNSEEVSDHYVKGNTYTINITAKRENVSDNDKYYFDTNTITWTVFDPTTATFVSNDKTIDLNGNASCRIRMLLSGSVVVSAAAGGQNARKSILVEDDEAVSIAITPPEKKNYIIGEELDLTGGSITVIRKDGSTEKISMTDSLQMQYVSISGYNKKKIGKQTVFVAYKNLNASFEVDVSDKPAKVLTLVNAPDQTEYRVGDNLNLTGGKIMVLYKDNTSAFLDITEDMIQNFDNTKPGEQKIFIKYQELSAEFKVFLKAKAWLFQDVPVKQGDWIYDSARFVYERDIMTGMDQEGTIFNPAGILSRGQFVTIIYRIAGKPSAEYESVYPDVNETDWFAVPSVWAYYKGIVTGYTSGQFAPADDITREQMAAILFRFAQRYGYDNGLRTTLITFPDQFKVSDWAEEAMKWAVANEIITGKEGVYLDPDGKASRAECATIIMRFMKMAGLA